MKKVLVSLFFILLVAVMMPAMAMADEVPAGVDPAATEEPAAEEPAADVQEDEDVAGGDSEVTDNPAQQSDSEAGVDGEEDPVEVIFTEEDLLNLVSIKDIKNTLTNNDPKLSFALNFAIKEAELNKLNNDEAYMGALITAYGDHYVDYVLTVSGLRDESVVFNAWGFNWDTMEPTGNAKGYLAGQYDGWSESWVPVPFEDVTVANGQSLYIMEYAAELMGKQGLRFTLMEVAEIVQNFDCGVYFTPEFLEANPDMEVELVLKVFTEDAEGNKIDNIDVATNVFTAQEAMVASVTDAEGITEKFASLENAIEAAEAGDVVTLSNPVSTDNPIEITKDLTIKLNGQTLTGNLTAGRIFVLKSGCENFTIDGTVSGSKVELSGNSAYGIVDVCTSAAVTLNGGTYTGDTASGALIKVREAGATLTLTDVTAATNGFVINSVDSDGYLVTSESLTVTGGNYTSTGSSVFGAQGGTIAFSGVTASSTGKSIIEVCGPATTAAFTACTFTGNNPADLSAPPAAVAVSSGGTVTINSGTYTQAGEAGAVQVYTSGGNVVVNGGTFAGDIVLNNSLEDNYEGKTFTATVNGGNFNGNFVIYGNSTEDGDVIGIEVTGGTFVNDPRAYVTEGTKVYFQSSKYTVGTAPAHTGSNNSWKLDEEMGVYVEYRYVSADPVPSTPADNVTNSQTGTTTEGTVTQTPTTNADMSSSTTTTKTETGEVKAETKVDQTTADKIVDKAVENKSEEVVIDATTTAPSAGTTAPAEETKAAEVTIPTQTMEKIAQQTEAAVTVKTDVAEVSFDKEAVSAIADQAEGEEVSIVVEKTKEAADEVHFELKVVTESGNVSDFKGGVVTVSVDLPASMQGKDVVCVYIDKDGRAYKVGGKLVNGKFVFTTGHFSTYVLMTAEEADAAVSASVADFLADLFPAARSVKTAKGNVKVTVQLDEEDLAIIDKLKSSGYTVQYKFYRSSKKSSGYKGMLEKAVPEYWNTYGVKGSKYYYKVSIQILDADGVLAGQTKLTQCRFASRTWTK